MIMIVGIKCRKNPNKFSRKGLSPLNESNANKPRNNANTIAKTRVNQNSNFASILSLEKKEI